MTTHSLKLALSGAGATALALVLMVPADAAGGSYVALGDSYSAGVGTRSKVDSCYRSKAGYPALLASRYGLSLSYEACSGATTSDVAANQVSALTGSTAYVSMTIGGNDVGFAGVLTECAKPAWMSNCAGAVAGGRAVLTGALPGRYDSLFSTIRSKAPRAKVVISGYPHIFMGEDCNALTFFSPADEASLNTATDDLDSLVRSKATAHGFTFTDPRTSFTGHAVCDSVEWVNGLSDPIEESYHPNRAGNVGLAALVGPALTGSGYRAPASAAVTQRSSATSPRQQADAVLRLGIASPANLAKASAAGISPAKITRLNSDLRSSDSGTVAAALAQLRTLDRHAARTAPSARG